MTPRPLPADWWLDIFGFIGRAELGASHIGTTCRKLHAASDVRLHNKCNLFPRNNERTIDPFEIVLWELNKNDVKEIVPMARRKRDFVGNPRRLPLEEWGSDFVGTLIELPQCPPPENIIGIKEIRIRYLDERVLTYLGCIKPLLSRFGLNIWNFEPKIKANNQLALRYVLRFLQLHGELTYLYCDIGTFASMVTLFPSILAQCPVLSIYAWQEELDPLLGWLAEPCRNKRPKMVAINMAEEDGPAFIRRVKDQFLSATIPSPFFICFPYWVIPPPELTNLKNPITGEEFTVYRDQNRTVENCELVCRHLPNEEEEWNAVSADKILNDSFKMNDSTIIFTLYCENIGQINLIEK